VCIVQVVNHHNHNHLHNKEVTLDNTSCRTRYARLMKESGMQVTQIAIKVLVSVPGILRGEWFEYTKQLKFRYCRSET